MKDGRPKGQIAVASLVMWIPRLSDYGMMGEWDSRRVGGIILSFARLRSGDRCCDALVVELLLGWRVLQVTVDRSE